MKQQPIAADIARFLTRIEGMFAPLTESECDAFSGAEPGARIMYLNGFVYIIDITGQIDAIHEKSTTSWFLQPSTLVWYEY